MKSEVVKYDFIIICCIICGMDVDKKWFLCVVDFECLREVCLMV